MLYEIFLSSILEYNIKISQKNPFNFDNVCKTVIAKICFPAGP